MTPLRVASLLCGALLIPLACARDWLFARGLAKRGDPAVLLYTSDPMHAASDSLRTVRLE